MADEIFSPDLMQALEQSGLLPHIAQLGASTALRGKAPAKLATPGDLRLAQFNLARGPQLADTPMPQGQVFEPGYQAPHPLEYVSAILRRGQGDRQTQEGIDLLNQVSAAEASAAGEEKAAEGPRAAYEAALKLALAKIAANRPQFHATDDNPDQAGFALNPNTGSYEPVGTGFVRPRFSGTPDHPGQAGFATDPRSGEYRPIGAGFVKPAAAGREGGDRPRPGDIRLVTGPGGEILAVNMTDPTAPPRQVPAPGGGALTRGAPQDVAKLSEDLTFVSKMPEDLAYLKTLAGKDVPGMGPLAGALPDWAVSEEGNRARQAATRLVNALIYMQTGKQINEAETARILTAEGLGTRASRSAFKLGVQSLERKLKTATRNFVKSRPPGVVKLAQEQGILKGLEPFLDGETSSVTTGVDDLINKYRSK